MKVRLGEGDMNRQVSNLVLWILILADGVARSQGGPPLITDDPGTPVNGKWEINFAFTVEKTHAATEYNAPLIDINYGLGDRVQLKYQVPLDVVDSRGDGTKTFGRFARGHQIPIP